MEKEIADISRWDGTFKHHKTGHTGLGVSRVKGPETPGAQSGPPPALGVSPRPKTIDAPPSCHHLKEALISRLYRSERRGETMPRGQQTHTAFPTLSGKLLPCVSS